MSRTRKGAKGPGWEVWSRRPAKTTSPGRETKRLTHRAERRIATKLTSPHAHQA